MGGVSTHAFSLALESTIWAGLQRLSVSWWLGPSPVPCLTFWKDFHFLPGGAFSGVHHSVALTQPHSVIYIHNFLCAPLQPMELGIFFALAIQNLIVVLSDVIEYHCPVYT